MAFERVLKNTTASDITIPDTGYTIPASGQLEVYPPDILLWAASAVGGDLESYLDSGDVVVNDGVTDLIAAVGKAYLYFVYSMEDLVEYDYFEDDTLSLTTSDGWISKLSAVTSALQGGRYLITWGAEVGQSTKNRRVGVRSLVDSIEIGASIDGLTAANDYVTQGGHKELTLSNGTHTLDIEFGQTTEGGVGYIRRARMHISRVGN